MRILSALPASIICFLAVTPAAHAGFVAEQAIVIPPTPPAAGSLATAAAEKLAQTVPATEAKDSKKISDIGKTPFTGTFTVERAETRSGEKRPGVSGTFTVKFGDGLDSIVTHEWKKKDIERVIEDIAELAGWRKAPSIGLRPPGGVLVTVTGGRSAYETVKAVGEAAGDAADVVLTPGKNILIRYRKK